MVNGGFLFADRSGVPSGSGVRGWPRHRRVCQDWVACQCKSILISIISMCLTLTLIVGSEPGRLLPIPVSHLERDCRPGVGCRWSDRSGISAMVRPGRHWHSILVRGRPEWLCAHRNPSADTAPDSRVHPPSGRMGQDTSVEGRMDQTRGSAVNTSSSSHHNNVTLHL